MKLKSIIVTPRKNSNESVLRAKGHAIQEQQMPSILDEMRRQLVAATQATAHLADLPDEEVEKLRSLEWEQEELSEKSKSVAVS
jgi:hypothetical protein